jgi:hypothetical protein
MSHDTATPTNPAAPQTTASTVDPHHYHRWHGQLSRGRWTWLTIASHGIRHGLNHAKTRTMVLSSFLLVVGLCIMFFVLAQLEQMIGTQQARGMLEFVRSMLQVDLSGVMSLSNMREPLWRSAFLLVMQVQNFWVLLIVARVGPGLISNDLKSRALPIYFSKPVTPLTYVLSKWLVVAAFVAMVTVVPNLIGLIAGTALTGGLDTWGQTLNLAWDLTAMGLLLMLLAGFAVLLLSSLTADRRYVTVGWVALCIVPTVLQQILRDTLPAEKLNGFLGSLSPVGNLKSIGQWMFDMQASWAASGLPEQAYEQALGGTAPAKFPAIVFGVVIVVTAVWCYRRVVRFSQSAANL